MATATSSGIPPSISPDLDHILLALKTLLPEGQVTELRALNVPGRNGFKPTYSGYFSDHAKLASEAARLSKMGAEGVYFIPNVVKPDLLARAANHAEIAEKGKSTSESGILQRRYLLIDFDPVRDSGISSTDEEHTIAIERAQGGAQSLRADGWPEPIIADSGNGGHVLYPIDLPAKDGGLVKRCLEALAFRFGDEHVVVDQTPSDPNRIWKLYGTVARKGDSIPSRPHRMARLLSIPAVQEVVSREMLEELAASLPQPERQSQRSTSTYDGPAFDLEEWIAKHNLEVGDRAEWEGKGHRWVFRVCPWNNEHTDRSAYILRFADGAIAAGCHHNGCKGKTWADLRALYDKKAHNQTPPKDKHKAVVTPFPTERKQSEDASDAPAQEDGEAGKETQQQVLLRIASAAHLFKTPTGDLFARVAVKGHYETWPIIERGSGFRRWLVHQYLTENGTVPNATALTQAMEGISARAQFEGETRDVYVRAAAHNGCIYLDLANDAWQIVEVSPDGWRILNDAPVYFRRPASILPLPVPVRGGSLDELRPTINVGSDSNWRLTVGWLLGTLHPRGPYPVLALSGERGSAKTDTTRRLRSVVDPAKAITRDIPKEARDLAIAANNSRVVALDNLSSIPGWFSDALCRLATGAGFATRALYTDDGEAIFDAARPIIFNGIEEVATRGDLLDRSIVVHLPTIEDNRCTAEELDDQFARAHPRILGALLNVVSAALRKQHTVRLERLPRMADFAVWVTAAEEALGWARGSFMDAYNKNRSEAVNIELESHPVARAIIALMDTRTTWEGTAAVLLAELNKIAGDDAHLQQWPKAANKLSGTITRLAPSLRSKGIRISETRAKSGKVYTIEHTPQDTPPPSPEGDDTQGDLSSPYRHQSPVSSPYRHPSNPLNASEGDDSDDSDDTPPLYSFVANKVSEERKEQEIGHVDRQGNLSSLSSPASQAVRLADVALRPGEKVTAYTDRMALLGFDEGEAVAMFYNPDRRPQLVERHNRVFATAS